MVVLRRLDALLEPTKDAVAEEVLYQKEEMENIELMEKDLQKASGYVFFNTSKWTMQRLQKTASNSQQLLLANFEEYLNGFSSNVKEIIDKFNLRNQISHMASKDVLLDVLEKFTSTDINLTPYGKLDTEGRTLPGLSNLGMGYVFEELIRKFNEENNEEAGEHFTPREVIDLMTHLIFDPIKDNIPPVITIYDPACGSGGMLTEAQNFIKDPEGQIKATGDVYLYGKEINDETYAICKSDMMIKGNNPKNIRVGSTLSTDEFAGKQFDIMMSNPPYGKSWSSEVKYIKDGKDIIDPRFIIQLKNYWNESEEAAATPRTSDGQLLFLMEMVNKMKQLTVSPAGSRIASVHNGSSLFTGDAGSGESNIRRHIIENDLLEAIIQLPNNLFYNTGITTYIWLLSNKKAANRQGKVQLIDASQRYQKLRKNLGNKNCEFSDDHIKEILAAYTDMKDIDRTKDDDLAVKVFDNKDFGYYKVTIERPLRLAAQFTPEHIETLRYDKSLLAPMQHAYETYGTEIYTNLDTYIKDILKWCEDNDISLSSKHKKSLNDINFWKSKDDLVLTANTLLDAIGQNTYTDYNTFSKLVDDHIKKVGIKLSGSEKKAILSAITWYDETAEKVVKKKVKLSGDRLDKLLRHLECKQNELSLHGYYPSQTKNEYIQYETSSDHRDTENVPVGDSIQDYFIKEVYPHVDEAWINMDSTKIGYEISFNKYFYQHKPLRSIKTVTTEIIDLEKESEGLLSEILGL
ncbi:MAG: type I restriction enzyme M protein [Halioglobus sp.]|jgi:type I restriction enzyme M protein